MKFSIKDFFRKCDQIRRKLDSLLKYFCEIRNKKKCENANKVVGDCEIIGAFLVIFAKYFRT